jgi:signal transduction histidine kinase
MTSRSLTRQTILAVIAAQLLCALAFSGVALWHEGRTRLRAFDVMLQGRSDSLLGAVQDAEDVNADVTVDPTELRVPPTDIFAVYNQGGRLLGSSANAPPALIQRHADGIATRRLGGHHYRVLQREALRIIDRKEYGPYGLRRPVTIIYASPSDHLWHEIAEAASFYIAVSLVVIAITATITIILLRRLLRPIRELAARADAVTPKNLRFVPPDDALRVTELRPLAETLTSTIASLQQAFEKQHRFVGDAAHELKTAVAVERSSLQVLMMRPRSPEDYEAGLHCVLEDNGRVESLVARMLTLARVEERPPAAPAVTDLAEAVAGTLRTLASFAEARDVPLTAQIDQPAPVHLTPEDADVLLTNIVVNAIEHSNSGSPVELFLTSADSTATLKIVDRGAGIAESSLPHVFERFYREDVSRSRATGGAGLGLPIAKSIVDAAGGTISIDSEVGAGTRVTVVFSLA